MNARRLSHLRNAGASAALEIARLRQDVLADIQEHISLSILDMAQCVHGFGTINQVDMQVCAASCGTRDHDDPSSREVILPPHTPSESTHNSNYSCKMTKDMPCNHIKEKHERN